MLDLHMHSRDSDGTDSPEELLQKISQAGINIFALTDHDTITGAMKMREIVPSNIKFIQGIEFSCITASKSKCHILGLNYDEKNASFQAALKSGEDLRHAKFFKRIEFLREKFGITFTDDEIKNLLQIPSVGKPHIANMLIAKGYASSRPEAIENFIDKCKTGNDKISAEMAINAILESGGVAVWAHPLGGEREPELPREKFIMILDELISYGLNGLECYYSKYNIKTCEQLAEFAGKKNLYVSGGSDYHGKNKSIPLGKLNAENILIDTSKITILEGV